MVATPCTPVERPSPVSHHDLIEAAEKAGCPSWHIVTAHAAVATIDSEISRRRAEGAEFDDGDYFEFHTEKVLAARRALTCGAPVAVLNAINAVDEAYDVAMDASLVAFLGGYPEPEGEPAEPPF
jgi:hypothetical protein